MKDTDKRFLDRPDEFYGSVLPDVPVVDALVFTPEELSRLSREPAFVRRALREGVILYGQEGQVGGSAEMA